MFILFRTKNKSVLITSQEVLEEITTKQNNCELNTIQWNVYIELHIEIYVWGSDFNCRCEYATHSGLLHYAETLWCVCGSVSCLWKNKRYSVLILGADAVHILARCICFFSLCFLLPFYLCMCRNFPQCLF